MFSPPAVCRDEQIRYFTSGAVFLMGALALAAPSGYSLGAALLLIASLLCLPYKRYLLSSEDKLVIITLVGYGALVGVLSMTEIGSKGFDRPSRFLLAVPVLLLILRFPPRLAWLWTGLACGAMGAGGLALWERLFYGVERASGYLHPIQFGNLSMLMGVLCLAGLGWAVVQRRRYAWLILLLVGALFGMLGSLMSGSRGGWIGLPFMGLVLYRGYGRGLAIRLKLVATGLVLVFVATIYFLPQTGVQSRVQAAVNDVSQYVAGEQRDTSLGHRFEMWRGAAHLISERPLFGWGIGGYKNGQSELAEQGVITYAAAKYSHAHNDFIDAWAKRGVLGLVMLLLLYILPIKLFAAGLQSPDLRLRAVAVAGTLLPVAYIDFGLSQTFLAHNSGTTIYAFWLAVLWGSYSAYSRDDLQASKDNK